MNHKRKHSAEQVVAAIADSAGIKATIARRLGVHWNTVDRYLAMYPSVALAYKNEVETVGDYVESIILEAIKAKDIETAKWYAKNKLKHRGYVERHEFVDIKEMSDDELIRFIAGYTGEESGRDQDRAAPGAAKPPTVH